MSSEEETAEQQVGRPAGRMVELDVDQCLHLLDAHDLGRLAVNDESGPVAFPVTYVLDRGMIVFRTQLGTKLDAAEGKEQAAFEIDGMDQRQRVGWSVIVRGSLEEIADTEELDAARGLPLHPLAAGDRQHFVALHPARITGYRIHIPEELSRDPAAAPDIGNVWQGLDGDDLLG